jgi:hypothetical protein
MIEIQLNQHVSNFNEGYFYTNFECLELIFHLGCQSVIFSFFEVKNYQNSIFRWVSSFWSNTHFIYLLKG